MKRNIPNPTMLSLAKWSTQAATFAKAATERRRWPRCEREYPRRSARIPRTPVKLIVEAVRLPPRPPAYSQRAMFRFAGAHPAGGR